MNTEQIRNIPKAENLSSPNGNPVPNQIVIIEPNRTTFQSYNTTIAVRIGTTIYLDPDHDCSTTTAKYRNIFLRDYCGQRPDEIKQKIHNDIYHIESLNL